VAGVGLSASLLGAGGGWAQPLTLDETPGERARVRLRTVRLRIEPGWRADRGKCQGLTQQDLKITIRGEVVPSAAVIEFERERRPTIHAIVIDTSQSMAGQLEQARRAATEYVEQLRSEYEKAMLLTFDDSVLLAQSPTAEKQQLVEAIAGVRVGSYTSLLDGLHYAIRELSLHRERPVLLLVTDGVDSASFHERDEVRDLLERRPDLTIFTIGVRIPEIRAGVPGLGTTKRFLQRLARNTHGEFFDAPTAGRLAGAFRRIREMLESEVTLTVVDPDPDTDPGKIRVASLETGCRVQQLPALDEAATLLDVDVDGTTTAHMPLSPAPDYERIFREAKNPRVDPACQAGISGDVDTKDRFDGVWYIELGEAGLSGCGLDIVMEHGLLHHSSNVSRTEHNAWIEMRTRPFEIPLPVVDRLPRDPVEAMDRLAARARSVAETTIETDARKRPRDKHARPYYDHPFLLHGRTFFDARADWARATYRRPEYRAWVDDRLREQARRELESLAERFRRYAPDASDLSLEQAILESEQGRAILARAEAPAQRDLQRYLGAWLGDRAAHDLFVNWEARRINRLLARPDVAAAAESFVEDWKALRRILFVPSYARLLTLLAPGYDPERGCVGYWRIVLPRPGWLLLRVQGWRDHREYGDLPLDLIPVEPLALRALERACADHPELARLLASKRYRALPATYELKAKPWKQGPERAFDDTRVTLDFVPSAASAVAEEPARLSIIAELRRDKKIGELTVVHVELVARGDAELKNLTRTQPAARGVALAVH
jgi:hypothetical protein